MKLKTLVQNDLKLAMIGGMLVATGCGSDEGNSRDPRREEIRIALINEHSFAVAIANSHCTDEVKCLEAGLRYYDNNVSKYGHERARVMTIAYIKDYHKQRR